MAKEVAVGFAWFLFFSAATSLVVRPMLRKVAEKTNSPRLAQVI